jgi:hypothetical protein
LRIAQHSRAVARHDGAMSLSVPVPRHLEGRPEDVRPRLARLGYPDEMTGLEPPVQRLANFLIAAERDLSHVQTRYFQARRSGDAGTIATALARKEAAERTIGRLRVQLYAERRQQLLQSANGSPDRTATPPRTLLDRFFVR